MALINADWLCSTLSKHFCATLWLPTTPSVYESACGISFVSEKSLQRHAGNLASYSLKSWSIKDLRMNEYSELHTNSICFTALDMMHITYLK